MVSRSRMNGSVPALVARRNSPLGYSVRSTTAALAAFVFTGSLPFSGDRRNKTRVDYWVISIVCGTIER